MTNYTSFSKEDFQAFKANDRPGPIHMLNLIKLRDKAAYEDGRNATGAQAYAAYGAESAAILEQLGGRIVWRGRFEQMVIGPHDENWDICFIAEYPSVTAFVEMLKDPDYRAAMVHRQAGVETSRLVRMAPLELGDRFG